MRVLIVKTNYPAFMSKFYGQNPGLANASFDRQDGRAIPDDVRHVRLLLAGAARHGPRRRGDVILNLEPAQKAWAREHGVSYNEGARRNSPIWSADHRPATWMRRICNSRFMRPHLRELCDAEQVILSFSIIRAKSELAGGLPHNASARASVPTRLLKYGASVFEG